MGKAPHCFAVLRNKSLNWLKRKEPTANSNLHIEIEATNICNTRCLHCPREALVRPLGKMDLQTYQTIMNKVIEYARSFCVVYCGAGEPLLNPCIYDFITYVAQRGRTSIITNGSVLTPEIVQRLIDAGIDQITVSFNGAEKRLYELMMGGLNFEQARLNLEKAVQMTRNTLTVIGANVSVTRQTQGNLAAIKSYLEGIGIKWIYFSLCHNRGGFLKGDTVCDTPLPPSDRERCDLFRDILFVSWTGEVLSCYHDLAGANTLGNLELEAIETILGRKKRIAAEGVKFDICRACNDLYRFCSERPPDGKALSDWVYDVYTEGDSHASVGTSSLAQWLYVLANHVKQSDLQKR